MPPRWTREIKERAYEAIVISEDVSTEDFAEEVANRKAEEAGEELSSSRKQARRERNNARTKETIQAVRYVNLLSRLARDS